MKRLILFVVSTCSAWGAIPAAAQWEVRTTGSNANGGFFVTGSGGTDYSQQNGAQYTAATATTSTTTLGVSSGSFTAQMVGNGVQISGGSCTAGFYEITVFNSAASVTIDRSAGTGSGCTINVGGGLLTIATALAPLTAGNTVWIQSGTYTVTASLSFPALQASIVGYHTSHGDNASGTRPLITTATNSVPLLVLTTGAAQPTLQNLTFSTTAGTASTGLSAAGAVTTPVVILNCLFTGFTTGISFPSPNLPPALLAYQLEVTGSTGTAAIEMDSSSIAYTMSCSSCYIHDQVGVVYGIYSNSSSTAIATFSITNTIFKANAFGAVAVKANNLVVENCSFFNSSTGGYSIWLSQVGTAFSAMTVINSVFWGTNSAQGGIIVNSAGQPVYENWNAIFSSPGTPRSNITAGPNDVSLTANPWVSATNFQLNNAAGGGALARGKGYPGVFPGGTTTGYLDMGAVQSQLQVGSAFAN